MSIEDVLESSYTNEEPEERLSVTGGPGIPEDELPDTSDNHELKEYAKRGAGILTAAASLYGGYELGTSSGDMTVENFLEYVEESSVENVLEGATDTGTQAAFTYAEEIAPYAMDFSSSFF